MSSTPHQKPFFFLKNEWKKIYRIYTNWEEIFEKEQSWKTKTIWFQWLLSYRSQDTVVLVSRQTIR